jgi:hypothetical protein
MFKEGACHAMAIELEAAFVEAGIPTEFWYLHSPSNDELAQHVVVKTPAGYFDVDFGPHSEAALLALWSKKGATVIKPVVNPAWLQTPVPPSPGIPNPSHSWLCLCTVQEFLTEARARARSLIAANRHRFGLRESN